jgi:N,N'-diacetylchitobiose phosphorylase
VRSDHEYRAAVLTNGRFTTLLSSAGGGCVMMNGYALTRWKPDPTLDDDGFVIYIRDLERGTFWRAAGPASRGYAVSTGPGRLRFQRDGDGISSALEVVVAAAHDAELRRLELRNDGHAVRRIDVTTCAELALNTLAADAGHPAFSKLFVQTEYLPDAGALLAWRRPRSPDETPFYAAHALVAETGLVEYETDRARFVGRGRSLAAPAAMLCDVPLAGTAGNVLDPLFSLRRSVSLAPGETAVLTSVLCAGATRQDMLRSLHALATVRAVGAAFDRPAAGGSGGTALDLPPRWRDSIRVMDPSADAPAAAGGAPLQSGTETVSGPEPLRGPASDEPAGGESLRFFNGRGGFSEDGSEYVILLPRRADGVRRPPLPWVNVLANEDAGCIVSEAGATYTWSANSRENRLTPWFNDPVVDPHGEALYIRDDGDGGFWSLTPGPCPGFGDYEARHGFGYSVFRHTSRGMDQEMTVFVPVDAPARIARVAITNRGVTDRRVTIFSYAQLVLGTHEADTRGWVRTRHDPDADVVFATQPDRGEFGGRVACAWSLCDTPGASSWTCDRREFLGLHGSTESPAAVLAGRLGRSAGIGHDPCVALSRSFTLAAGQSVRCAFVLGEAADEMAANALAARFTSLHAVDASLEATQAAWARRLDAIRITTPSPALDVMVNGWLAYQNLCCRMWARSAYYQSGGAYGYRDQLQDASALLYLDPAITRRQILLHAAHQFQEGDVLHWWHPPTSKGIRTRFSDDLLWLPYITAFYVGRTGDAAILDEDVRYIHAPALAEGVDEEFVVPEDAGVRGSLYDHCCRALDRSLTRGVHGLPLMGAGDWNDGMNRVGRGGRGESVWLGFFLYDILRDFIPICTARGDTERSRRYASYRHALGEALNDAGWDGAWYRRAYYDNGEPLGSAHSDECRIDALAQAWAVLSGAAPASRAAQAMDALETQLVSEPDGIIRLLAPAFDRTPNDPGYIKGYLPGVRENGGQYTHGVLWAVRALAELGRTERAATLLEMLTPVHHAATAEGVERYRVEPYVVAADVYGVEPHVGRGGWTWYTGSAGWMYRIAIESILGLALRDGDTIALRPCIPAAWPGFSIRYRMPDGTVYDIEVERSTGATRVHTGDGSAAGVVDGAVVVPAARDGREHRVRISLGHDVGPRYAPR